MNATSTLSGLTYEAIPKPPLIPWMSDRLLLTLAPVIIYWVHSLTFHIIDTYNLLPQYRLHTPAELLKRNHVSMGEVFRDVVIQQLVQMVVGYVLSLADGMDMTGHEGAEVLGMLETYTRWEGSYIVPAMGLLGIDGAGLLAKIDGAMPAEWDWRLLAVQAVYWAIIPVAQIWGAVFFLDTWQYFLHRAMHTVPFLYRNFHSRHHRLYVPYAFGALYNHPFEGFLMDTIGAGLAFKICGLSQRQAIFFFSLSSVKTADDHCGYKLPWDPLQLFFKNNAAYHDIHHQGWGIKTNFSQPFFICWDRWLNTQWTGNSLDLSAKYARSRATADKLVAKDAQASIDSSSAAPLSKVESKLAFPDDRYTDDESEGASEVKGKVKKGKLGEGMGEVVDEVERSVNGVKRRVIMDPSLTS